MVSLCQVNRQEETPPPSDVYRGRRDVHVEPGHQDSATAVMHATNASGTGRTVESSNTAVSEGESGLGLEKFS